MSPRDGYVLEFDDQHMPHVRESRMTPTFNPDLWMSLWGELYIVGVTVFFSLVEAKANYIKHLKLLRAGHRSAIQELDNLITMAEQPPQPEAPTQEGGEVEKWDCCDEAGNNYSWLEHGPEPGEESEYEDAVIKAFTGNDDEPSSQEELRKHGHQV